MNDQQDPQSALEKLYQDLGKDICLYPFFGAFYQTNNVVPRGVDSMPNSVRPCSIVMADDRHKWDIESGSIRDARNSPAWRQMRRDFVEGRFHDIHDCRSCSYNEKTGTTSPRQQNNKFFAEKLSIDLVQEVQAIIDNDYAVDDIITLDYYPSNYCNFSCIMCAGGASSKRQAYEVKVLNYQEKIVLNEPDQDFYSVLDRVEIINFTGGETVLQRQVHDIIDYLIARGRSQDILITLLTNASSYPEELVEKFRKFRGVIYNVSIDGVSDVIEYQRRNARWSEVAENSLRLIHHEFIVTVVNYVLTAVNVFTFMDFVDWAYGAGIGPRSYRDMSVSYINVSPVFRVDHLGQGAVPPELRSLARERLLLGQARYREIESPQAQYYVMLIQRVIDVIDNTPFEPRYLPQFREHIRREDSVSRKKLVEVVPEWLPWFTDSSLDPTTETAVANPCHGGDQSP